ncbi:MAG: tyrosine-type recombinase/integrase [Peptostreptococcaceae bacterium]|nr:tyrosine-type recombinase/integrase [Peptostreptococcaceae bacterium]
MNKPTDFAYSLTKYLTDYLSATIGASKNTIISYRDTFKLLLIYTSKQKSKKPEMLVLADFDRDFILDFLDWLENERGCSVQTRNQRLTAVHAFCKYLQIEHAEYIFTFQKIIAIPKKKCNQKLVSFLSIEGIELLLQQPDASSDSGKKHLILLTFMYATACRVQEAVDAVIEDYKYNGTNLMKLTGKGKKSRLVPLEKTVVKLMDNYIESRRENILFSEKDWLFLNHSGQKLSRQGVSSIIKKYADMAREKRPDLIPKGISPHTFRHSRAVHWLQAGVELVYIRDLLGHVSVQTTEVYVKIDSDMKRKALEKLSSTQSMNLPEWQKNQDLMAWLKSLGN